MVILQVTAQVMVILAIFALALFVPGDSLRWLAGWIFLGAFFVFCVLIFGRMYNRNPGLLRERMRLGASDQEYSDKILFPVINVVLLVWLTFVSLDATRFHWSVVPV